MVDDWLNSIKSIIVTLKSNELERTILYEDKKFDEDSNFKIITSIELSTSSTIFNDLNKLFTELIKFVLAI